MKQSLGAKTLIYPAPTWVVGTYDKDNKPNAMTAAWGGICCSQPPCVAVSLRKATYSYGNIVERKAFTVNVPSADYVVEADYFGIETGRNVNKFSVSKLTPIKSELVDAPYVAEFPMVLECSLLHTIEIGLHTQFIGEIKDVKVDKSILDADNTLDIQKVKPFIYAAGEQLYYAIGDQLGKAFSIGKKLSER